MNMIIMMTKTMKMKMMKMMTMRTMMTTRTMMTMTMMMTTSCRCLALEEVVNMASESTFSFAKAICAVPEVISDEQSKHSE